MAPLDYAILVRGRESSACSGAANAPISHRRHPRRHDTHRPHDASYSSVEPGASATSAMQVPRECDRRGDRGPSSALSAERFAYSPRPRAPGCAPPGPCRCCARAGGAGPCSATRWAAAAADLGRRARSWWSSATRPSAVQQAARVLGSSRHPCRPPGGPARAPAMRYAAPCPPWRGCSGDVLILYGDAPPDPHPDLCAASSTSATAHEGAPSCPLLTVRYDDPAGWRHCRIVRTGPTAGVRGIVEER